MFCPKCGKGEQQTNAYCRGCGEFLQDWSKSVRLAWGGATPAQNVLTTLFFNILSAVFALLVAVALLLTFYGQGHPPLAVPLAVSFSLCIAGWQISSFFVSLKLRRQFQRRQAAAQKFNELSILPKATNNALPAADTANIVRPSSITENTTDLLIPVLPERSVQNQ